MRVVVQDTLSNRQWVAFEGLAGFTVGRDPDCVVCLGTSRFVSRRHFEVERGQAGWELRVHEGATAVSLDGQPVEPGRSAILRPVSRVRLAEFVLTLVQEEAEDTSARTEGGDVAAVQREMHASVLRRLDLRRTGVEKIEASTVRLEQINDIVDDLLAHELHRRVLGTPDTRDRLLGLAYQSRLAGVIFRVSQAQVADRIETPGRNIALEEAADDYMHRLMRKMGVDDPADAAGQDPTELIGKMEQNLPAVIEEMPENIQVYLVARFLKKVVCDMIFGLGPLQDLLDTPAVTEIMIVGPDQVYLEFAGKVLRSNRTFLGDDALMGVIERIVSPLGRRIDRSQPLVDARLPDGSRVNAIIPPLALNGPCLTIRRFPGGRITAADLVRWGSLTDAAHALLEGSVKGRKNIIVAGGTGSGKTTLLNVLSSFIPEDERIVTIEDAAELRLDQEHVVSLETRPPNVEGKGAYTIQDLVKNALRMRPDRIVVGECRGAEAVDMLQAMNTGHDGSLTTIHANSSQDVVSRIENMCLMAVEMPVAAIRRQVAQAVDLVVFIRRLRSGKRMITQITEVTGVHPLSGEVEMRDVMAASGSPEPKLRPTGYLPGFIGDLVDHDLIDLARWFGRAPA